MTIIDKKIAIIGLGYVGLPLLNNFSIKATCWGLDSNSDKVALLNVKYPQLKITSDWKDIKDSDFYIVAVPTPIDKDNNPDITPLKNVCKDLAYVMGKGNIIVFESTVYPGATEEVCIPIIESLSGLKVNKDFYVGYSPERINVGDTEHQLHNTPKIVSSSDSKAYETIKEVYQSILSVDVIKAGSIKVAEAAKMYENVQRDVLIALANEFSEYCRAEGIDMREVTACALSKWNFSAVNPGLVGGHCISVDPYYLIDRAAQKGLDLSLVKTARNVNEFKPEAVASRISDIIVKQRTKVEHPLVLLLGITYKANTPDCRNTKIPNIIQFLERRGIKTIVYDPIADSDYVDKEYNVRLITVQELKVMNFNLVIQMVNHDVFECLHFDDTVYCNLSDLL